MSDYKVFQCPNCQQFINNTMTVCKFCSASLDESIISSAVENKELVDNAYSSANSARILAGTMASSYFLSFIPLISFIFAILHYIAFALVPIFLLIWIIRFSGVKTQDTGYTDAKKFCWTALFIWLGFLIWHFVIIFLVLSTRR